MLYLYYIFLGFLPSVIWLTFYLRKDKHPEPNWMVIQIFIWGMLLSPLALILELLLILIISPGTDLSEVFAGSVQTSLFRAALIATFVPAIVEEYLKYSIVRSRILKNPEFDEPVDLMLYLIIAALGFAAVENLLVLSKFPLMPLNEAVTTMTVRFLGATFLHALAAGIVGYFLALGLLNSQKRKRYIAAGLTIAILFHACYNYFITQASQTGQVIYIFLIILLLIVMAIIVSRGFVKLKKQLSICK